MNNLVGAKIKECRINSNLTQDKLAENIGYSVKSIRNAENGNPISIDLLNKLSIYFKIDFNRFYYSNIIGIPFELQSVYFEFTSVIENSDYENLNNLVIKYQDNEVFLFDEPRKLILYAKSVLLSLKGKYDESFKFINELLLMDNIYINHSSIQNYYFSLTTYRALSYASILYNIIGDKKNSKFRISDLYKNLKSNFFSDTYIVNTLDSSFIRLFAIVSNNYAYSLFEESKPIEALEIIDDLIDSTNRHYNFTIVHNIYFTKFECLYSLDKLNEAVEIFELTLCLCKLHNPNLINSYFENIETNFVKIAKLKKYLKLKMSFID